MVFLSESTIRRLVRTACEIDLDCDALIEVLPSHVKSTLGSRSPRSSQLLVVLSKLSSWQPRGVEEPPLCTFLRYAHLLTEGRVEAEVFEEALAEFEERRRRDERISSRPLHDVLMRRAKRFYASYGYEVVPPETERSGTFLAFRGVGIVSVVAVADDSVEEAISAVTQLVQEVRPNEPCAEGYVVLTSKTPDARRADEAKVREANLRPVLYTDLPPMGSPEIESFVRRQHAWILAEPDPPDLPDADRIDALLEDLARRLLSDCDARVVVLSTPSPRALWRARKRIAHACSEDFSCKPDAPAPLVLPLRERPVAGLEDLVAEAFRAQGVRFSPIALVQLLESGAFLPIFTVTNGVACEISAWLPLVRQAVVGKAKAVLLACDGSAVPIPSLVRHLNVPSMGVRVITA